ncbi:hypothetical protein [Streptomyces bohaiensis]|uniref:Uncharacterized protein n=1 Tax=Streptomyces bohaiensis TaxID=1431344 RepID=A0ABX1C5N4_9ACTN|nr:hypothetical protein [Streptomyces bohaiensis]NJQ13511.1 hypothetical protein [Streptomyces bohaiensis]
MTHMITQRTPADQALAAELLHRVRTADAQIPAHRRAPRTLAEMRAREEDAARCAAPVRALHKCPDCGQLYHDGDNHTCGATRTPAELAAAAAH